MVEERKAKGTAFGVIVDVLAEWELLGLSICGLLVGNRNAQVHFCGNNDKVATPKE